jgi:hypothetical protein
MFEILGLFIVLCAKCYLKDNCFPLVPAGFAFCVGVLVFFAVVAVVCWAGVEFCWVVDVDVAAGVFPCATLSVGF